MRGQFFKPAFATGVLASNVLLPEQSWHKCNLFKFYSELWGVILGGKNPEDFQTLNMHNYKNYSGFCGPGYIPFLFHFQKLWWEIFILWFKLAVWWWKCSSLSASTIRIFWHILPDSIFCRNSACLHDCSLSYIQFVWLQYTLNKY